MTHHIETHLEIERNRLTKELKLKLSTDAVEEHEVGLFGKTEETAK